MAKFECQMNTRPADIIRNLEGELQKSGLALIDSSTYTIGGVSAHFQVWERLSLLVIGTGNLSTVTAVSESAGDIGLVESGLGL